MRYDVNAVWDQWEEELFGAQEEFEADALKLYREGEADALKEKLTGYTMQWGSRVVRKAWELGDMLWTRYDEQF
jgi:hypothetical protein